MIRELLSAETGLAFAAVRALRGDIADERAFVRRVEEIQRPEGYRLVGAFEEGEASACAVAGFRTGHSLAWGDADTGASCSTGLSRRPDGSAATRFTSTPASESTGPMPIAST